MLTYFCYLVHVICIIGKSSRAGNKNFRGELKPVLRCYNVSVWIFKLFELCIDVMVMGCFLGYRSYDSIYKLNLRHFLCIVEVCTLREETFTEETFADFRPIRKSIFPRIFSFLLTRMFRGKCLEIFRIIFLIISCNTDISGHRGINDLLSICWKSGRINRFLRWRWKLFSMKIYESKYN